MSFQIRTLLTALLLPLTALAGGEQVLVVPYAQSNHHLPHPAHEAAPTSLKAMLRGADCRYYRVRWDTDRDGSYDDESEKRYRRDDYTHSVRDIGRTWRTPLVDRDTLMAVNVRAISECDGSAHFGTYRLFVANWSPAADPRLWTDEQIEVLGAMALDEVMWFLHRRVRTLRGIDSVDVRGRPGRSEVGALQIWLNAINDHQPAYPPGTVLGSEQQPLPEGWAEANDDRWATDPYAEDSVRLLNDLLRNKSTLFYGIGDDDEGSTCGYDEALQPIPCARLPQTTDGIGVHIGTTNTSRHGYLQGITVGGLAPTLPALAGVPIPVGHAGLRGHTFEWLVQQMTDYLGYMQADSGCARGGWYYYATGNTGCSYSDGSTSQWSYIGLESAQVAGSPYGVVVDNRHKYRLADNLIANQDGTGGSRYRTNRTNGTTFQLTGGAFVGARWLGIHDFSPDDQTVAFPGQSEATRAKLRSTYDRYLGYSLAEWHSARRRGNVGWVDGFWRDGDYLCSNTSSAYNVDYRCGNTYALYSFQKGFRTGQPELLQVGEHDWYREFATYYVRAQRRAMSEDDPWSGYADFGEILDGFCDHTSVTCNYSRRSLTPMMAGLVLTPTIFNAKPYAIADVSPTVVTEGCVGGRAGRVTFEHHRSFHPNDDAKFVAFQWDVDASNGLWWELGTEPDFEEAPDAQGLIVGVYEHTYLHAGDFVATLRVVDDKGLWRKTAVEIHVDEADNVPPAVTSGGPYVVEEFQHAQLNGAVVDVNTNCGDVVATGWDLDNDGDVDVLGASPLLPWWRLLGFPRSEANPITLIAEDSTGARVTVETQLIIHPRDPVAIARANPIPAACGQTVTFDGTASAHPDPRRRVVLWEWDVDGVPGWDGGGAVFRYAYGRYGTFPVQLRVTDDLGHTATVSLEVDVSTGHRPPEASVAQALILLPEGDALQLDGRASTDPDLACGDAIVEYAWDVDGNGHFDDAVDVVGQTPEIPWITVEAVTGGPPLPGEPAHTMALKVTDTFGESTTTHFDVRVVTARPVPVVEQTPNPGKIFEDDGHATVVLDGRGSYSPLPDVRIVRYEWDLDADLVFEISDQAVVEWSRVFDPVPLPMNIPEQVVYLRVTDDAGRTRSVRHVVDLRVGLTPPTADADPDHQPEPGYHVLVDEPLVLDGSASVDPDAPEGDRVYVWRWDLDHDPEEGFQGDVVQVDEDGDGSEALITLTPEQIAEFGLNEPGEHAIALEVEDTTGLVGHDVTRIIVHPVDPEPVVEVSDTHVEPGQAVVLDARASHHDHPDIEVETWRWDLDGDGVFDDAEGPVANVVLDQFTFGEPIPVAVEITDSRGHTAVEVTEIFVDDGNHPPEADAGGHRDGGGQVDGPYIVVVGESLQLSAGGSQDPDAEHGDAIVEYTWDLDGDGEPEITGAGPEPAPLSWVDLVHAGIDRPGDHTVVLGVTDRFGTVSEATTTVRVVEGPQARIEAPGRVACADTVTFDGRVSSTDGPLDQGFGLAEYAWDLDGDGLFDDATDPVVSLPAVAQPDRGAGLELTVSLRVTDESGRIDIATRTVPIDVQNQPPSANAGGPYSTGPVGNGFVPVLLDGRGSADPNEPCDRLVTYKWDVDNDGVFGAEDGEPEGPLVEFEDPTWAVNTARTIGLVVCDAFGACSAPADATIEILSEAPPRGRIATPTAEDCVAVGPASVTVDISDPEGDPIDVRVVIGGRTVGQLLAVPTPVNGDDLRVAVPFDPQTLPEGRHHIQVELDDRQGGTSVVQSNGRVLFDRTAPEVEIGPTLGEDVCYANPPSDPRVTITDAFDEGPVVTRGVEIDGCRRTLVVTATDACGNVGRAARSYLMAEAVSVTIDGPDAGERVAEAAYTWQLDQPVECYADVTARISHDGQPAAGYPEGALINLPGQHVMTVRTTNCAGIGREQVRWLRINRPPESVPHPPHLPGTDYLVDEGSTLRLDGRSSRPPEADDWIIDYAWDFDDDGQFDDAAGGQPLFPTDEDGLFRGHLEVTDDLFATDSAPFQVIVRDVDPTADAGGPYEVDQGSMITFDGSASRPANDADQLTVFEWSFGDGHGDHGVRMTHVSHTFVDDGWYEVGLTVHDEDSTDRDRAPVHVRDVDPIIVAIHAPDDPRELFDMEFSVDAVAGAPGDPITRYEWDFDGDGVYDVGGPDALSALWVIDAPGPRTIGVRVHDPDSFTDGHIIVDFRQCTFPEVITWEGERIGRLQESGDLLPTQAFVLSDFQRRVGHGLWGERWDRRGNTLVAVEAMAQMLRQAVGHGVTVGFEAWVLARQQIREIRGYEARIRPQVDTPTGFHQSLARAEGHIERMEDIWESEGFREAMHDVDGSELALDLQWEGMEAFYWLHDAIDDCSQNYDEFKMPLDRDPVARTQAANPINDELKAAWLYLRQEMEAYNDAGAPGHDFGPGFDEVQQAIADIEEIRRLQYFRVGSHCDEEQFRCVTDGEALDLLLRAEELVRFLSVARSQGVYVRNWRTCMALGVKFRTELSILRTEFACGEYHRTSRRLRRMQSIGLRMFNNAQHAEALDFYADDQIRCVMEWTYNECLVPVWPATNQPVEYDSNCHNYVEIE